MILYGRVYYYSHFTGEETETLKVLRSHSHEVAESGLQTQMSNNSKSDMFPIYPCGHPAPCLFRSYSFWKGRASF